MNLNSDSTRWGILIVAGILLTVLVYGQIADQVAEIEQNTPSIQVRWHPTAAAKAEARLSNPASMNCVRLGGTLKFEKDPNGGQFGVCIFPNNNACEEWALLRSECPTGGVSLGSYRSPQGRFCALRGGLYKVIKSGDVRTEVGTCTPAGSTEVCDGTAFWYGKCPVK